ncbi:hypothetical protein B566_EDAN012535 [Ephemera danica]|nr:hypothetical protein B566_EDAN012535 [Ephemera danica]
MAYIKLAAFAAILSVAHAGVVAPLGYAAPVARFAAAPAVLRTDYDAVPQYSYAYSVSDAITGDNKNQQETRNGDIVQGSYSLVEPDGTVRTVNYVADPINGFNAVVDRRPAIVKAAVAVPAIKAAVPVAAPFARLGYAAPALAPAAYAAPAFAPAPYAAPAFAPAAYAAHAYAPAAYAAPAYAPAAYAAAPFAKAFVG